jgi:rhodanese-related sulfurtransferase
MPVIIKIKLILLILSAVALFKCNPIQKYKNNMKTENQNNGIIIDVRSREEWEFDGHSNCSINIPLDELDEKMKEILQYDKITFVCRSGARAGVARAKLLSAGYSKSIENLGPWQNVVCQN